MSDMDKWVELGGPEPEAVREVFDPLRAMSPTQEEVERIQRNVLEALGLEGTGALPAGDLPLDFEAWASLSALLLGLGQEDQLDVLEERGVKAKDWQRCNRHYLQSLAADVEAGRMARANAYAAKCAAEIADRKRLPEASAAVIGAPADAAGPTARAPAAAAAPTEVATFQRIEQNPALAPAPERKSNPLAMTAGPVLMSTAMRADQGKLPFVAAAPVPPPPPPPLPGTEKTVPLRAGMGATQGPDPMAKVHAALPFLEQTGVNAVPYPRMAIETFASLCAEIAVNPGQLEDIFTRYRVANDMAYKALENDWLARMRAKPELFTTFGQLVEVYKAHVRSLKK